MLHLTSSQGGRAVSATVKQHLESLSRLMFLGYSNGFAQPADNLQAIWPQLEYVSSLNQEERLEFLRVANIHHVTVRALQVLKQAAIGTGNKMLMEWVEPVLSSEVARIHHAVQKLAPICSALEAAECKTTVIKSLDHWPDLGSDLDLYTTGTEQEVVKIMQREFNAELEPRSWGDRLAHKWNFAVPGLPELIEIHVRYLGQTGEHADMARRVAARRVKKSLDSQDFLVPAPEERILISTLQRMYRHFYFRLCDMSDVAALLQSNAIDFAELRRAASVGRIWPGVATFLLLVSEYAKQYGGAARVPQEVLSSATSQEIRVFVGGDFLRVPKLPAAGLYGSQLFGAGIHGDLRAALRLSLLPPLAMSALVAYHVTGSDKGIW